MRASEQFRIYVNSPIKYIIQFFIQNSLKEIPFEELSKYVQEIKTGKTPPKSQSKYWDSQDYNWFKPQDIGFDIYLEDSSDKISHLAIKENQATVYPKNTLLITGIGDLGRLGILRKESSSNQQITGVLFNNKVLSEFAYFYLLSIKDQLDEKSSQTTLPILNQKKLSSIKIKIPSVPIQEKFVKFMLHCWKCLKDNKIPTEDYKLNKELTGFAKNAFLVYYSQKEITFINNKNENYISKLSQQILQEAVRGKLVKQDSKDEPASELFKKIKAEKEKLIKEGKIRKDKPLAPISDGEKPYELPKGWEWVRLSEIGQINPRNYAEDSLEVSFVPMTLVSSKFGESPKFEIRKWGDIKSGFTHFRDNDVVLAKITPCFENSKAGIMKGLKNGLGAGTTELHVFRVNNKFVLPEYVYIYFKSTKFLEEGATKMTGTAGQQRVPVDYIAKNPFPLSPFPEQKRIVEKVDKLMALCDELEEQVKENQDNSEKLMEVVLRESF